MGLDRAHPEEQLRRHLKPLCETPSSPGPELRRIRIDTLTGMAFSSLVSLAIVFAMSFGANRFSQGTLQAMFWGFALLMGLSMSTIFLVYTGASIAQTFFATAAAFAGLSIYGYTTKRNLSGMGSFMAMGVIGLIIAMLLNLWLQSGPLAMAISGLGVLIFAGLTAWDTQRLRETYYHVAGTDMMGKVVIMGALSLYLDFVNMFQFLLQFMGQRR